jgi:hypothetical protein
MLNVDCSDMPLFKELPNTSTAPRLASKYHLNKVTWNLDIPSDKLIVLPWIGKAPFPMMSCAVALAHLGESE